MDRPPAAWTEWSHLFTDARGYSVRVTGRVRDGLVELAAGADFPALLAPMTARMLADALHYAAAVATGRDPAP